MLARPLLLAFVLAASLLAGCADDGGDGTTTTSPATTSPAMTPVTTTPSGGEAFVVGTDAAFPPFEELTVTGAFEGFDIDVMDEIAFRNGWTVSFQNLAFDALIPSLQSGDVDLVISAMSINENRSQVVDFSIPYYEANQSISQLASDTNVYASLDDLEGKGIRFGAQSATVAVDIIEARFPGDELKRYDTYPLALQALAAGEVDVVMMDAPAQKEAAQSEGTIKVAFEFSVGDVYGIAVPKGSADLAAVNDALEAMQDDGTLLDLREKWGI